ncbi:MAG: hypothetical protein RL119_1042, partial [Actinomycetota bacterium]
MRPSSDLPGGRGRPATRRPDWASKGRIILLVVVAVVVVLFLSARSLANFYVDLLWFDSVDRSSVFWKSLGSKAFLAAFFSLGFAAVA